MALLSVVFVGLAVFFLQFRDFSSPYHSQMLPTELLRFIFWTGLGFFGLGFVVSILMLLPGAGRMTLDEKGIEIKKFFMSRRIAWKDTANFAVFALPLVSKRSHLVVFDNAAQTRSLAKHMNTLFSNRNDYLSDTYGFLAADLVRLLNKWRERALQ